MFSLRITLCLQAAKRWRTERDIERERERERQKGGHNQKQQKNTTGEGKITKYQGTKRGNHRATLPNKHPMSSWWPNMWAPDRSYGDMSIYIYIYIYLSIYIYAVESKLGPKIAFFLVKTWSNFSQFFLFSFFKNILLSAGRMRFLKKNEQNKNKKNIFLSQNLVQFCCATYLDQVLTQPWTKFWLNIFANFGVFLPVWKDAETTIFIVFSAENWIF